MIVGKFGLSEKRKRKMLDYNVINIIFFDKKNYGLERMSRVHKQPITLFSKFKSEG